MVEVEQSEECLKLPLEFWLCKHCVLLLLGVLLGACFSSSALGLTFWCFPQKPRAVFAEQSAWYGSSKHENVSATCSSRDTSPSGHDMNRNGCDMNQVVWEQNSSMAAPHPMQTCILHHSPLTAADPECLVPSLHLQALGAFAGL